MRHRPTSGMLRGISMIPLPTPEWPLPSLSTPLRRPSNPRRSLSLSKGKRGTSRSGDPLPVPEQPPPVPELVEGHTRNFPNQLDSASGMSVVNDGLVP
ncbi:hypothetical protein PLANTIT3_90048 [Plantibacter sp. T3]|nr:hypothetical protein PLANTIT3_90048 [Plantibacter sp. T3]